MHVSSVFVEQGRWNILTSIKETQNNDLLVLDMVSGGNPPLKHQYPNTWP